MSTIIDELSWRGLIAQSTDLEALRAATSAGSTCSTRGLHSI